MGGNALYVCASVCIKERIWLYWMTLHTEAVQSIVRSIRKLRTANCVPQTRRRSSSPATSLPSRRRR